MNTAEILKFPGAAPGQFRSNRMENQKSGYIPLYRSVLKQSWAKRCVPQNPVGKPAA
ncbi:Uncharacterised protein [Klebsiella pneumoniae]|uniref:Uncharacterized protein n=1 Tax=Klebsiella pneumoniae TaxID=573 RepID=A0A4P0Y034_KLEPN|nr:Uncharacterised protein [Klebsiella pneumoniae]